MHLGLRVEDAGELRYQLLHRTASAAFEAERYGAEKALMLVHSFSAVDRSLDDYRRFADALGLEGADTNAITTARTIGAVELRLGWVADIPAGAR
jgi:hypothetical protein